MGLDSSIYSFSRQIRRLKLDLVYEYVAQSHDNDRWKWKIAMQCVRTGARDRMCVCGCVCVFALCAQNIFWCYMKNNHLIVFVHNLVKEIFNLSFSWCWLKHAEKVTSNVSCAMFCSVHIIPVWFVCTMYIVHTPNTELWQLSAQREVWDKHRGFLVVSHRIEWKRVDTQWRTASHSSWRRHMFQTT